jgi:hypothetical protein
MVKVLLWTFVGVLGLIVLGSLIGPSNTSKNPDARSSVGYLPPGQCMSAEKFNGAARTVVGNTDWSKVSGSVAFTDSTKSLVGGVTVFKEMARLGTPACEDLEPLYSQYLSGTSRTTGAEPIPNKPPAQHVTLLSGANILSAPSAASAAVRVAKKGDTFNVFDTKNGWMQIGSDKGGGPEGWIAANLLAGIR